MHSALAHRLCAPVASQRLLLEPMGARHADAFFGPLQSDALYQWISMNKPASSEWLRGHWERLETRMAPDESTAWSTWAVRRQSDGAYIGRVDAEVTDALEATNFGYYFFSEYWGQGLATEAVVAAVDHLVLQGVHRLVATVTAGNAASVRVLNKAGFIFTQVLKDNDTLHGMLVDDEEYVKTVEP